VHLAFDIEHNDRQYLGDAAFILGAAPPPTERVRVAAIGVTFDPLESLTLEVGWRRERRSSAIAFGSYDVGIVTIGARLAF
jgi:hypothetical protein